MQDRIDFMKKTETVENQPAQMMLALDDLIQKVVGAKLVTLMRLDLKRGDARRIYSNRPAEFPISGSKILAESEWTKQVLDQRKIFVANSLAEMEPYFVDTALIRSVGCESCLNLPVVVNGRLLGTLNCLHEAGYYTPDRVAAAESLKLPAAIALMASFELEHNEDATAPGTINPKDA